MCRLGCYGKNIDNNNNLDILETVSRIGKENIKGKQPNLEAECVAAREEHFESLREAYCLSIQMQRELRDTKGHRSVSVCV